MSDINPQKELVVSDAEPEPRGGSGWIDPDTGVFQIAFDQGAGVDWVPVPPVAVTEDASTFAESDVTVTNNKTTIGSSSVELGIGTGLETVDGFESGDLVVENSDWSDWSGDTASLSAQQSTVLEGNSTGELAASGGFNRVQTIRSSEAAITRVDFTVEIDGISGTLGDLIVCTVEGPGGDVANVRFNDNESNWKINGNDTGITVNANQTYAISVRNIDYTAETLDLFIDGTSTNTGVAFDVSNSGLDEIEFNNDTTGSGNTRSIYIDGVQSAEAPATSGDALIEWDSGVPADIDSYDLVSFQATEDGETVTVDVEDGSGTVLYADVDPNFDITTVDPSKTVKLRANLSRSNTANNPTVDYAARRYTR
jgi:hypothetical protein